MSETIQYIIVALVLLAAIAYTARGVIRKGRSMSPKRASCEADCGCGSSEKAARAR
ncbi:MAG: FeoB-associated Cys-rich membrane protein [Pyrinomonadaceae bacterium]